MIRLLLFMSVKLTRLSIAAIVLLTIVWIAIVAVTLSSFMYSDCAADCYHCASGVIHYVIPCRTCFAINKQY